MSDKFHIGQPVWWRLGGVEARRPAVIYSRKLFASTISDPVPGWFYVIDAAPYVTINPAPTFPNTCVSATEEWLEPRDQDQFTPADETFDWRSRELT